jgi:hypothetical protein
MWSRSKRQRRVQLVNIFTSTWALLAITVILDRTVLEMINHINALKELSHQLLVQVSVILVQLESTLSLGVLHVPTAQLVHFVHKVLSSRVRLVHTLRTQAQKIQVYAPIVPLDCILLLLHQLNAHYVLVDCILMLRLVSQHVFDALWESIPYWGRHNAQIALVDSTLQSLVRASVKLAAKELIPYQEEEHQLFVLFVLLGDFQWLDQTIVLLALLEQWSLQHCPPPFVLIVQLAITLADLLEHVQAALLDSILEILQQHVPRVQQELIPRMCLQLPKLVAFLARQVYLLQQEQVPAPLVNMGSTSLTLLFAKIAKLAVTAIVPGWPCALFVQPTHTRKLLVQVPVRYVALESFHHLEVHLVDVLLEVSPIKQVFVLTVLLESLRFIVDRLIAQVVMLGGFPNLLEWQNANIARWDITALLTVQPLVNFVQKLHLLHLVRQASLIVLAKMDTSNPLLKMK